MKVLMVGVSKKNKGGMWTVVENYINSEKLNNEVNLTYIPTVTKTNKLFKLFYSFFAILKVKKTIKKDHMDVLHINMSERGSVYRTGVLIDIAHKYGCKAIIHMHGAEFQTWYEDLPKLKQEKVKKIMNSSDSIMILGNYWRKFVETLVDDGKKIKVLYNAVTLPTIYKYNNSSKSILYLGLVGKRKGIFDLIEAVSQLKKEKFNFNLIVYGPDETAGIEEIIKSKELEDYIHYKGWLENSRKKEVFSSVKANILPSYNEGLPMTILETMSYGIPNITTPVAAIPEVVNQSNGFIVMPGNIEQIKKAVKEAIINDQTNRSKKCRETIKNNFSLESHINKLLSIYRETIGRGK